MADRPRLPRALTVVHVCCTSYTRYTVDSATQRLNNWSLVYAVVSKIKFSGKVYIFLDFFVWKFILILRYYPTVF